MKVETALNRILNSDASDNVKMMKLWCLAARQMSGSPAQQMVKEHWNVYFNKVHSAH